MKKTFFKAAVATSVLAATMALCSVATMAAQRIYNIADVTNISTWHDYDDEKVDGSGQTGNKVDGTISAETTLTFGGESDTTGTNPIVVKTTDKPAAVQYDVEGNSSKNYLTESCGKGSLKEKVFTKAIITFSGATGEFMEIQNLKQGELVELYYFGSDTKGAPGKTDKLDISNAEFIESVIGSTENKKPSYVQFTVASEGPCVLSTEGQRVGICAIVVNDAGTQTEPTIYNVKSDDANKVAIVKNGTDYYAIVMVSKDEADKNSSFTINSEKTVEQVFTSVEIGGKEYQLDDFGLTTSEHKNSDKNQNTGYTLTYLYGIQLTGDGVTNQKASDIQSKISVEYVPIA